MDYFLGVDVGTGSVRGALFDANGKLIKIATNPIETFNSIPDYYEQSSEDIWESVKRVVKNVTNDVKKEFIKGIGFDATCSLVLLDESGQPVTASVTGDDKRNVILWLDHRAEAEANFINMMGHNILKYVGGKISLEMEIPKILWLKKNLPKSWSKSQLLFDLPDFLTWKATGSESRSLCSLVCKWNYTAKPDGKNNWCEEFFNQIGLASLKDNNWKRIGNEVKAPGEPVGKGLSVKAAAELGLNEGTPVGTSIIDAHAGGLGMIGCSAPEISNNFTSRLSLICGTSTCHMAISTKPIFVNGVWGPYYSAMVPSLWLNEGGQSATGKLLDHVIDSHPASSSIKNKIYGKMHIQQYLSNRLQLMTERNNFPDVSYLTQDFHVWPDFHGNRSPLADPTLQGMISGLSLSSDEESLAVLYLATMQALTYGTKHILDALILAGHRIESILICGGLSQNSLFVQTQADVLGLPVLIPQEKESVLLGAAILGCCAAVSFSSVSKAIRYMAGNANVIKPKAISHQYHCRKYKVFQKMVQDQKEYKKMMNQEV
ncbi:FGGY carbohydrate kinase domain-containing protein [Chelonus insularis]|uniref:FGGY carbohydrate kinase domain-containing protein n=1 Tax=Chelonus insularis TaxID=460826 RepID=UPI0015883704|nr:FGGY carbohydrate kinase domain-containing protein [Chelonus insularis]XP_034949270.1 FGGY carbohydrate kinase domain-containing protein [Chelonus insularis]